MKKLFFAVAVSLTLQVAQASDSAKLREQFKNNVTYSNEEARRIVQGVKLNCHEGKRSVSLEDALYGWAKHRKMQNDPIDFEVIERGGDVRVYSHSRFVDTGNIVKVISRVEASIDKFDTLKLYDPIQQAAMAACQGRFGNIAQSR